MVISYETFFALVLFDSPHFERKVKQNWCKRSLVQSFVRGSIGVTYDKHPKMKRDAWLEKDCFQSGVSLHFWAFVIHWGLCFDNNSSTTLYLLIYNEQRCTVSSTFSNFYSTFFMLYISDFFKEIYIQRNMVQVREFVWNTRKIGKVKQNSAVLGLKANVSKIRGYFYIT